MFNPDSIVLRIAVIAVITPITENTPIAIPSIVSAERSLCAFTDVWAMPSTSPRGRRALRLMEKRLPAQCRLSDVRMIPFEGA
jgi:hypothetical protein